MTASRRDSYDETGFFTYQPWAPKLDFPPAKLSFGTWEELGDQFHITFFAIEKVKPVNPLTAVLEGLNYAIELHKKPSTYRQKAYGVGPEAYSNWIKAAEEHGSSQGNWWNAIVWSECRKMASRYFSELGNQFDQVSQSASDLEAAYAEIASALGTLSDKEMDAGEKVMLLEETKEKEAAAVEMVIAFADSLGYGR